jgi:hypothetical protein
MNSYMFDIGEKSRKVSRFIGEVRAQLQRALAAEKSSRRLTQQQLATMIGTDRAVINRQLMGYENLTLRRVAEFAWAFGWDIHFELRKTRSEPSAVTSSGGQGTTVINLIDALRARISQDKGELGYKRNAVTPTSSNAVITEALAQ